MRMVALGCLMLAGCAGTIDQDRARPPAATFSTSLPEPAMEQCLAGKLYFMGTPAVLRGQTSTEIAFNSDYGTELLVTITPAAGGSKIELRLKHHNYLDHIRRAVQSCL